MLTATGCRVRRDRLWAAMGDQVAADALVLTDPINLRYLANFHVDPFALGADFGGVLVIERSGKSTLYHDRRLPESVSATLVDHKVVVPWYDGVASAPPRRLALLDAVQQHGGRIHDSMADPLFQPITVYLAQARRAKDADEIGLLRDCMTAGEAGQEWGRKNAKAGMTELDVYEGIFAACASAVGRPSILYGDFAVSPGSARRGGPPTNRILANGDTMILDFSVILFGYRSDFTNTVVIGGQPTADQKRLFDACVMAMKAGESLLRAGSSCKAIYDAVYNHFASENLAQHFPHHAGHGLGLGHPEAPFLVRDSTETLIEGDVVTLEPGLYVDGIGGIRIEHNYLIGKEGFERLSNHLISLT